jgi:hypothetical protein
MYTSVPHWLGCTSLGIEEAGMRVWIFTVALVLGAATWAIDMLGDGVTGPDQQTVTMMDDPIGPPKP